MSKWTISQRKYDQVFLVAAFGRHPNKRKEATADEPRIGRVTASHAVLRGRWTRIRNPEDVGCPERSGSPMEERSAASGDPTKTRIMRLAIQVNRPNVRGGYYAAPAMRDKNGACHAEGVVRRPPLNMLANL
jgi:hypothetical protein